MLALSVAENIMHAKPEFELIADSQNGDTNAMTELFRRHYPGSLTVARRILPARDESSDAVQAAYLSAFRNFHTFRGTSSFKTWITRIVMNQCLMHIRDSVRHRRCVSLEHCTARAVPVVDRRPTPEDLARGAEVEKTLIDTARKLPQPLRDTFILNAFSDLPVAEIATALGITVAAAKTRLFRARSFMRSELKHIRRDYQLV
jgi:RNA polymerase sigma-70 factor, ECF subfamily